MRNTIKFYLNGRLKTVSGSLALLSLSDYLRYEQSLTGTKVVCAEGDCGACTVLIGKSQLLDNGQFDYKPVNSCITFMYLLDGCHIISVEALGDIANLSDAQECMVDNHGAQCGYCTPGFICSMTALQEDAKKKNWTLDEQKIKNYLTGNLCRCTGYDPIIEAGKKLMVENYEGLNERFSSDEILAELSQESCELSTELGKIFIPSTLNEALKICDEFDNVTIVSGATDLGVLKNKGKLTPQNILCLNNIKDLYKIDMTDSAFSIGAKVNLHQIEKTLESDFSEFTNLIHIFASPQIKNRATLVGNVANGSPIGDSMPFLMAANATIVIKSVDGSRELTLEEFYKGYKDFDLRKNELITAIKIPKTDKQLKLYKTSVRKDLDISAVTFAASYSYSKGKIDSFKLVLGGVGPYVLSPKKTQAFLQGKDWDIQTFKDAANILDQDIKPLSDLRGTDKYRMTLAKNLLVKFFYEVNAQSNGQELRGVTL